VDFDYDFMVFGGRDGSVDDFDGVDRRLYNDLFEHYVGQIMLFAVFISFLTLKVLCGLDIQAATSHLSA
jgi:hypothetical protein